MPVNPVLKAYGATNVGQRERNEDYFLVDDKTHLYVVADGMGGHTAGNFASCFTSGRIRNLFKTFNELEESVLESTIEISHEELDSQTATPEDLIRHAIWDANKRLRIESRKINAERPMGTTIAGAFFFGGKVYLFNVGDSRAYRIYRGSIQQITADHSQIEKRIKNGELTADEAAFAKGRNILTRAIGAQKHTKPDIYVLNAQVGDRFFLCSDGLSNMVAATSQEKHRRNLTGLCGSEETMSDLVFDKSLKKVCEGLVGLAQARGGRDNITAVIIEVLKEGDDSANALETLSNDLDENVFEETIPYEGSKNK